MKSFSNTLLYLLLASFFFIPFQNATAQIGAYPVLDKGPIESQLNSVLSSSSQYEYNGVFYKGIKIGYLTALKTNINDTLKTLRKKIITNQQTIVKKDAIIDSLNRELGNTGDLYLSTIKEKNSLRFLGITFSKTAYNSLMWGLVLGLAFLLIILMILYRRNNAITIQTKQDLTDLKNEFEAHRKRALEREEKLSRKHLDELNKYKK